MSTISGDNGIDTYARKHVCRVTGYLLSAVDRSKCAESFERHRDFFYHKGIIVFVP